MPRVAVLTLPGFNEIDSFVALHMLNRAAGVTAFLAGPANEAVSLYGVPTGIAGTMNDLAAADAVLVGSGRNTRDFAADADFLAALRRLDPARQLIGSQCSGALLLAKAGLLDGLTVCTDDKTRPWIEELGFNVVEDSLRVAGAIATAGGCLSAQHLATWALLRLVGEAETRRALAYVVPVGDAQRYADDLIAKVRSADPATVAAAAEG